MPLPVSKLSLDEQQLNGLQKRQHTPHRSTVWLQILSAQDLPRCDVVGYSDPYVVLTAGNETEKVVLRTYVCYNTGNPVWEDETYELANVFPGCVFSFEVFDKDQLLSHDFMGRAQLNFSTRTCGPPGQPMRYLLNLMGQNGSTSAGQLTVQLSWAPSRDNTGELEHRGPVRYRYSLSALAGSITGADNSWRSFAAYKIMLFGLRLFFPQGASQHWNENYDKAVDIFRNNKLLKTALQLQHAMLYKDGGKKEQRGVLKCQADLMGLLWHGKPRYYTYVLMEDSLRFSETGAAFFKDMFSKHAMHAGVAEEVVCAGEFLVLQDKVIIDNNSGTYAHSKEPLIQLQALLKYNLPDLVVEVVAADDPELERLHQMVPARMKITQATAKDLVPDAPC